MIEIHTKVPIRKMLLCLGFFFKYWENSNYKMYIRRQGTDSGILTVIQSWECVYEASEYNSL